MRETDIEIHPMAARVQLVCAIDGFDASTTFCRRWTYVPFSFSEEVRTIRKKIRFPPEHRALSRPTVNSVRPPRTRCAIQKVLLLYPSAANRLPRIRRYSVTLCGRFPRSPIESASSKHVVHFENPVFYSMKTFVVIE